MSILHNGARTMASTSPQVHTRRYPIYTRAGDGGKSSLLDGQIRIKSAIVFDVMGGLDELSSHLGVCCEYLPSSATMEHSSCIPSIADGANNGTLMVLQERIRDVQRKLFLLNASVANRLDKLPGVEVVNVLYIIIFRIPVRSGPRRWSCG